MGTSQVFSARGHSYAHAHGLVELQKYVRAFQIPNRVLIPRIFFWPAMFAPISRIPLAICNIKE